MLATMFGMYDRLLRSAAYHNALADRLADQGEHERARAYRALGRAYGLMPEWENPAPRRGEFYDSPKLPAPSQLRDPDVLAAIRTCVDHVRDRVRRIRLADVLWEFGGNAQMARTACKLYLEEAAHRLCESSWDWSGASRALRRAFAIARQLQDRELEVRAVQAVLDAIALFDARGSTEALYRAVEPLIAAKRADLYDKLGALLAQHRESLRVRESSDRTQLCQQKVLELLLDMAHQRGDTERVRAIRFDLAETKEREARAIPEAGGWPDIERLGEAARMFEQLGCHDRAESLRREQRESVRHIQWKPFVEVFTVNRDEQRSRVTEALATAGRSRFWGDIHRRIPLPMSADFDEDAAAFAATMPLTARLTSSEMYRDDPKERVDGTEATRRAVRQSAYAQLSFEMCTIIDVAAQEHGISAGEALAVFASTGRFDATALAIANRILHSIDEADWLTAAHLAPPLFERLVRRLAEDVNVWARYANPKGGRDREQYVAIETLLADSDLPLTDAEREFARYVLTDPGCNLRNGVAHGFFDTAWCTAELCAQILHLLLVLVHSAVAQRGWSYGMPRAH